MPPTPAIDLAVNTNGLRIYTRRRPGTTTPPLLLLHGIGGTLDAWAPLLDQMPDRDIVMVDCPGAGASQRPILPLLMTQIADIVVDTVKALGLERVDLLGYSLGGMVAQEIARRHPEFVGRLILASTSFGLGAVLARPSVLCTLFSTDRYRSRARAERDMALLAGGRTARDPDMLDAILAARAKYKPDILGYYYQHLAAFGWGSYRWLPSLAHPTLVLHGDDDPVIPVRNGRNLARRIPHAQLEILPGGGHLMVFDQPDDISRLVEAFLE